MEALASQEGWGKASHRTELSPALFASMSPSGAEWESAPEQCIIHQSPRPSSSEGGNGSYCSLTCVDLTRHRHGGTHSEQPWAQNPHEGLPRRNANIRPYKHLNTNIHGSGMHNDHTSPSGMSTWCPKQDTVQPDSGRSSDRGSLPSSEHVTSSERSQTQKAAKHERMYMKCPE